MKRKNLCMAIGCVLVATAMPAWSQEAPSEEGTKATQLGTVIVTARKREETLQDVPVAVTAFTSESLDRLNVRDLADLGAQVPNMTIYAARGSNTTLTAYIRGVGQSDPLWGVDPGVGLYLDDVYLARPQGALLDIVDVERIEVLRGPQGTLYGKNTIGGAIKYITRGLPKETSGNASVTIGNYGQLDVKASLAGAIGGDEALRARISAGKLTRDGFGENILTGDQVSDKDIGVVRAQLGAYIYDDTDVQFSIDWLKDGSGVRGARMLEANRFDALLTPGTGPFLPMDSRYDVRNGMSNLNETTLKGASVTVNHRFNDNFDFKYVLAKRESDTVTNIDFDTTPDKITDVKAYYSDEQVSNELQLNYDGGGRWRGVTGLYFFNGSAGGQVLNNFFNLSFGDTQGTVYTESAAIYTDWTFDISDKLKLDIGARYTDEDKRAKVLNRAYSGPDFTTVIATPANFDKTVNFTNLSPKVSLDYQVNQDVMVYGLFSRGFKSGGYNIRANATAVPRSADPFDDEQVDSFEIGSKMSFMNQQLFLNLSAFHNKYEDIQLSVFTELPGGGFFGDFTNAGQGTVNGFEAEYQFLPNDNWVISGNLAWLDAKYDEYMSRGVNIADEETFTNAPDFSGAINVEWRTDLANGGRVSAQVGYSYQSDVVATTETKQATTLPLAPFGRPPISQDGYGLVNAGVIWSVNDAWTLSLQGTNLADKEYMTTGYNLNQAVGVYTGFFGAPRQYSLTARYDF